MNPKEISERLGIRAGYELVNYGFVGLPVFRVSAEALCIDQSDMSTVDEFLLRSIQMGVCLSTELSHFLGLPIEVIRIQLADLMSQSQVKIEDPAAKEERLALTPKGRASLLGQIVNRPRQSMLDFTFDGLLRTEKYYPESSLQPPRDLRLLSIPFVRGVPDSGPEAEHLNPININKTLKLASRTKNKAPLQVLKILHVRRRTRLYLQTIALLFKSQTSGDLHVGFAIDGRLSEEHEEAFQKQKGTEKNKLFANFESADPLNELEKDMSEGLSSREIVRNIKKLSKQSKVIEKKQSKGPKATSTLALKKKPVPKQEQVPAVRRIPVIEHHDLLIESISSAQTRLLIISPWIRREIVDLPFLKNLESALKRDVRIFIGYGIGAREERQEIDGECNRDLRRLGEMYENLVFRRFGNTHAKILLKDSMFYVVSSFNWLSFRGDPSRPFREEWGNMVSIPSEVDAFFDDLINRFK